MMSKLEVSTSKRLYFKLCSESSEFKLSSACCSLQYDRTFLACFECVLWMCLMPYLNGIRFTRLHIFPTLFVNDTVQTFCYDYQRFINRWSSGTLTLLRWCGVKAHVWLAQTCATIWWPLSFKQHISASKVCQRFLLFIAARNQSNNGTSQRKCWSIIDLKRVPMNTWKADICSHRLKCGLALPSIDRSEYIW